MKLNPWGIILIFKKLKNQISYILYYLTTNTWIKVYFKLRSRLEIHESFDLLISIGLPFHIHWVVSKVIAKKKDLFLCKIADYGDPFSTNTTTPVAPYFKYVEKKVLKQFDFITVPIPQAIASYLLILILLFKSVYPIYDSRFLNIAVLITLF